MPITLAPETEERLEAAARVRQTDVDSVLRLLLDGAEGDAAPEDILPYDDFVATMKSRHGSLEAVPEAEFLAEINRGFPESFWQRYTALRHRAERDSLTDTEREELLLMVQRREQANVERLKYVIELARREGIPPRQLWQRLGLGPE